MKVILTKIREEKTLEIEEKSLKTEKMGYSRKVPTLQTEIK